MGSEMCIRDSHVTTNNGGFNSTSESLCLMNHGDLIFATAPKTGGSTNYPSGRMIINTSGNVGIGENNPAGPLHVTSAGHASIFEGTGGNVSLKLLRSDASGAVDFGDIQFANSTGIAAKINSRGEGGSASGNLTFQTRNTSGTLAERMRIDSSGNVGIGTVSPSAKLEILSDGSAAGCLLYTSDAADE